MTGVTAASQRGASSDFVSFRAFATEEGALSTCIDENNEATVCARWPFDGVEDIELVRAAASFFSDSRRWHWRYNEAFGSGSELSDTGGAADDSSKHIPASAEERDASWHAAVESESSIHDPSLLPVHQYCVLAQKISPAEHAQKEAVANTTDAGRWSQPPTLCNQRCCVATIRYYRLAISGDCLLPTRLLQLLLLLSECQRPW